MTRICPDCGGKGFTVIYGDRFFTLIYSERLHCGRCDGTGEVEVPIIPPREDEE